MIHLLRRVLFWQPWRLFPSKGYEYSAHKVKTLKKRTKFSTKQFLPGRVPLNRTIAVLTSKPVTFANNFSFLGSILENEGKLQFVQQKLSSKRSIGYIERFIDNHADFSCRRASEVSLKVRDRSEKFSKKLFSLEKISMDKSNSVLTRMPKILRQLFPAQKREA